MQKIVLFSISFLVMFGCFAKSFYTFQKIEAPWVCPAFLEKAVNTTAEFRSRFTSPVAEKATLRFAGDTSYSLSLNGTCVKLSARNPHVPPLRFFDTYPIELQKGENELRIKLYVQGDRSIQQIEGHPSFFFDLTSAHLTHSSAAPLDVRPFPHTSSKGWMT